MTQSNSSQPPSQQLPKRILLVEDEQYLHDLYQELLTSEHYSVDTAMDGDEALQKIQAGGYDLVLLDVMLPKKDALTILELLQTSPPKIPNKKTIFLTNLGQETILEKGKQHGVTEALIKSSMTPEEFLGKVKDALV